MSTVKAVLTKPLDGFPEGTEREFDKPDFDRLKAMGAVRAAKPGDAKAAPAVQNKMAPAPANKDISGAASFDHDGDGTVGGSKPRAKS